MSGSFLTITKKSRKNRTFNVSVEVIGDDLKVDGVEDNVANLLVESTHCTYL